MFLDFKEDVLPRSHYISKFARHKVYGGWYVRVLFTEFGPNKKSRGESALFLPDKEHCWNTSDFKWQMIKKETRGGVYRSKVIGGWLVVATIRGLAESDSGENVYCRTGSLVFVPDPDWEWKCTVLEEVYEIFKV